MKKKILAAILAAAMTLALAACGGQAGEAPTTPRQPTTTQEPQTPAPEPEPEKEEVSKPSTDANAELEGKLDVSMSLSPTLDGESQKYIITIRNLTNEKLISAGIYFLIRTQEDGKVFEEYALIEDLEPSKVTNFTGVIATAHEAELVYLWSVDYTFEEPVEIHESEPPKELSAGDMALQDQYGMVYIRLLDTKESVDSFLGDHEYTAEDTARYLSGTLMVKFNANMVTTFITDRQSLQTPRGIHPGSSVEDIIKAYGEDYLDANGLMLYTAEAGQGFSYNMAFLIEDGVCVTITMMFT